MTGTRFPFSPLSPLPRYPLTCISRSLNFCIFPEAVIGNESTKRMWRGILNRAMRPLQNSRISSAVAVSAVLSLIAAATSSPNRSSGTP